MSGHGTHYDVDGGGTIDCACCDATSPTIEAHTRHMEVVHDS
ncbi:hypothetical protein [Haloarcula halophila]